VGAEERNLKGGVGAEEGEGSFKFMYLDRSEPSLDERNLSMIITLQTREQET